METQVLPVSQGGSHHGPGPEHDRTGLEGAVWSPRSGRQFPVSELCARRAPRSKASFRHRGPGFLLPPNLPPEGSADTGWNVLCLCAIKLFPKT